MLCTRGVFSSAIRCSPCRPVKPSEAIAADASSRSQARNFASTHAFATTRAPLRGPMFVSYVSIVAHVEDGRVVQLGGDPAHPVTGGFLCWRTNNFLPLQYHPERLTTPLLRGNPVSWDEALDFAARELTRIRAESGPQAIFHYRSGGSLGALKHLTDYFFSEFGPVTSKRGD